MASEHEILRETARFLDSAEWRASGVAREDARAVVQAWLATCFDGLGKAPALLDGDDVAMALAELFPAHFGARDPRAAHVEAVLGAFLEHQERSAFVPHAFEQRQAFDRALPAFQDAVRRGELAGRARALPQRPLVHRAEKVGRNDPCPCGSGKKFKACCGRG